MQDSNTVVANGEDGQIYILDIAASTFIVKPAEDANDSSDEQESEKSESEESDSEKESE